MKRSIRLFYSAQRAFAWSLFYFLLGCGSVAWAAGASTEGNFVGVLALGFGALVALIFGTLRMTDSLRLRSLARRERAYETDLTARIQRRGIDADGNLHL